MSNNAIATPEQLTVDDLNILKRAFPRASHEFINGYVYLTEAAVCDRIEEVDPAWTFEVQRMSREGDQAVCCGRLTIKGVTREGVGMYRQTNPNGEPEKSAATDAIKRCARLFSVGRYLLNDPPKEGRDFDKWLSEQQKVLGVSLKSRVDAVPPPATPNDAGIPHSAPPDPASVLPRPTPANGSPASTPNGQPNGGGSAKSELFPDEPPPYTVTLDNGVQVHPKLERTKDGVPVLGSLNMVEIRRTAWAEKLVSGKEHFANLIDLLWRDGYIRAASTPDAVLEAIRKHEAAKDLEREAVGK